jgi:ATP-dependent exoDNAse (exonuclease V) alpha subunit
VNATTGVVEDIIWAPESSRSDLPIAVMVSCKTFKGPTLWRTEPRPDFPTGIPIVPVTPLTTTFELEGKTLSRTQLPLRMAWAVTIHKSQGLTLDRIRLGLGKKEFSTGLTFVALSRVKTFDGIAIVDRLVFSRVRKLGGKHLQSRIDDYARRYPRNI